MLLPTSLALLQSEQALSHSDGAQQSNHTNTQAIDARMMSVMDELTKLDPGTIPPSRVIRKRVVILALNSNYTHTVGLTSNMYAPMDAFLSNLTSLAHAPYLHSNRTIQTPHSRPAGHSRCLARTLRVHCSSHRTPCRRALGRDSHVGAGNAADGVQVAASACEGARPHVCTR